MYISQTINVLFLRGKEMQRVGVVSESYVNFNQGLLHIYYKYKLIYEPIFSSRLSDLYMKYIRQVFGI